MQIRLYKPNELEQVWKEVETSKETKNFGTHRDENDQKNRAVSHKQSGLRVAVFTTRRDAHKFNLWCEKNIGDKTFEEIKAMNRIIYTHVQFYPSYAYA